MNIDSAKLPSIAKLDLADPKQAKVFKNYVLELTEQLKYVLSNIETDNLAPDVLSGINSSLTSTEKLENAINKQRKDLNTLEEYAENLKSLLDDHIMIWFTDNVPALQNYPASEWDGSAGSTDYEKHKDDLCYNTATGKAYKFTRAGNSTTYSWELVQDEGITSALAAAASAQDTADKKRRVFVSTPTPPYDVGDLWVGTVTTAADAHDMLVSIAAKTADEQYSADDWVPALEYTVENGNKVSVYKSAINQLQSSIEMKVSRTDITNAVPLYSKTDPSLDWNEEQKSANNGFLWYDADSETLKQWDTSQSPACWIAASDVEQFTTRLLAQLLMTAGEIALKVSNDGIIAAINLTPENVKISGEKITIDGAVTINGAFRITETGYPIIDAGQIGNLTINPDGTTCNGFFYADGMTLKGNAIYGCTGLPDFVVRPGNLIQGNYSSGGVSLLGYDGSRIVALDLVYDTTVPAIAARAPGNGDLGGSGRPTNPDAPNCIISYVVILPDGDGVQKRASMSTSAASLGSCSQGEMYIYKITRSNGSLYLGADEQSETVGNKTYRWVQCIGVVSVVNNRRTFSTDNFTSFWIRDSNAAITRHYYNTATFSAYGNLQ